MSAPSLLSMIENQLRDIEQAKSNYLSPTTFDL